MATWTSVGHAMRRRMGAPSNHHEAAGKSMSKDLTPEQITASGARAYMGSATSGFTSPSATPVTGKLMPKKNTQASDPTIANKANRANVERKGAQYRITAKMPAPINIEAGATMANAKIIPSVAGKQAPNFYNGVDSTY
ncbi:hypothetical protein UFOVP1033_71 [uncultured Caudovirales phage]|uniref:Uncharacterized protein n=1 Tax=uncultured Caudovirales phage TaxID=2100421 RepID=A0A6J5Q3X2_9CAUD|nr:hypothetical protein UFOVP1033_71 [uncultured Caudovirales phage]CAB4220768.1 hypothetical protein UFOVP1631_71 [uncultured Caudovirales phage]